MIVASDGMTIATCCQYDPLLPLTFNHCNEQDGHCHAESMIIATDRATIVTNRMRMTE